MGAGSHEAIVRMPIWVVISAALYEGPRQWPACSKWTQTGWLIPTEIYSLTVEELQVQGQSVGPFRAPGEVLLAVSSGWWLQVSLAGGHIAPSLPPCSPGILRRAVLSSGRWSELSLIQDPPR